MTIGAQTRWYKRVLDNRFMPFHSERQCHNSIRWTCQTRTYYPLYKTVKMCSSGNGLLTDSTVLASSVYSVMCSGGAYRLEFQEYMEIRNTAKHQGFLISSSQRKITNQRCNARHFNCAGECVMCDLGCQENAMRLFFKCDYSTAIWNELTLYLGSSILEIADSV